LVLAAKLGELALVAEGPRVGEVAFDLPGALDRFGDAVAEAQAPVFPYFWRKRSMRPAVSMSFCLPVKNGWQFEQMSVWITGTVERVSNVLPHAHWTVAVK
jgi:hypothetical protein